MAALAAAVRPFAGGVPRGAAPASERASGKMKPQRVVAPARDSSACCLAGVEELYAPSSQKRKMTCKTAAADDTKVLPVVGGEVSAWELLQKRLACELDVLRGLLKKAELISRRGPSSNGGAPTAAGDGKKDRFLASNSKQRSESVPMEDGGGGTAASAKRRKISTPRTMSAEERNQLAGRLSSLSGELPGRVVEFLLKQYGDADAGGEIEINTDSVEDSVLFELKTELDKFAQERERPTIGVDDVLPEANDEKLAEESKSKGILQQEVKTGSRPSSRSSSGDHPDTDGDSACERCSDEVPAPREKAPPEQTVVAMSAQPPPSEPPAHAVRQSGGEAKKVQDVVVQRAAPPNAKAAVYMPGLIYRANLRRKLLEMERAALPDQSIHRRDLQRLGIAEYGHPGIMRQLGLFLKADDA